MKKGSTSFVIKERQNNELPLYIYQNGKTTKTKQNKKTQTNKKPKKHNTNCWQEYNATKTFLISDGNAKWYGSWEDNLTIY